MGKLTLFAILSDPGRTEKLQNKSDLKLKTKKFWAEDEETYLKLLDKINREHKAILPTFKET